MQRTFALVSGTASLFALSAAAIGPAGAALSSGPALTQPATVAGYTLVGRIPVLANGRLKPGDTVELNPQPLPPRYAGQVNWATADIAKVALNPQPLPPVANPDVAMRKAGGAQTASQASQDTIGSATTGAGAGKVALSDENGGHGHPVALLPPGPCDRIIVSVRFGDGSVSKAHASGDTRSGFCAFSLPVNASQAGSQATLQLSSADGSISGVGARPIAIAPLKSAPGAAGMQQH